MPPAGDVRVLFVAYDSHLAKVGGGVQKCTQEFLTLLRAADIAVEVLPVQPDRRLSTRIRRRASGSPYLSPIDRNGSERIQCAKASTDIIVLNQVALAGAAIFAKSSPRDPPCIIFSHGPEITDLVHVARVRRRFPIRGESRSDRIALANVLTDEVASRTRVAGVVSISPFDDSMEAWLGSKRSFWIPRIVKPAPLNWAPTKGRFGFVGTLGHGPNLEGILDVLDELSARRPDNVSIRIVGGPRQLGNDLASTYGFVDYLGPLDDDALALEASTWTAFLNPIFCLARGCSTKLAAALGWQLPVITTPYGRRGYVWEEGAVLEAKTPAAFVDEMLRLSDPFILNEAHKGVIQISNSSPSIEATSVRLGSFLRDVFELRRKSATALSGEMDEYRSAVVAS